MECIEIEIKITRAGAVTENISSDLRWESEEGDGQIRVTSSRKQSSGQFSRLHPWTLCSIVKVSDLVLNNPHIGYHFFSVVC